MRLRLSVQLLPKIKVPQMREDKTMKPTPSDAKRVLGSVMVHRTRPKPVEHVLRFRLDSGADVEVHVFDGVDSAMSYRHDLIRRKDGEPHGEVVLLCEQKAF